MTDFKMPPMEDKDFGPSKGNWFELGVYEVYIQGVTVGESPNTNSKYLEFALLGPDDQEGTARLYLTEMAAPYTRNTLAQISVHNADTEEAKQKVRDYFRVITDPASLADSKLLAKFKDKQAWIDVYEDDKSPKSNGGFYTRTKLTSYEPKHREPSKSAQIDDLLSNSTPVDDDDVPFN